MSAKVEDWLHGIGMVRYAEQFRSNWIDSEILLQPSSDNLKDIGVAPLKKSYSSAADLKHSCFCLRGRKGGPTA